MSSLKGSVTAISGAVSIRPSRVAGALALCGGPAKAAAGHSTGIHPRAEQCHGLEGRLLALPAQAIGPELQLQLREGAARDWALDLAKIMIVVKSLRFVHVATLPPYRLWLLLL